jgi:hypothetical protein
VVVEGLKGAAEFGTADAFRSAGLTALAKTGTAAMPGGGFEGLVIAVTPADRPTRAVVVMAPGAAGRDAARLAVDALASTSPDGSHCATVAALSPVVDLAAVRTLQDGVESIRMDDALVDYAMTIVEETRRHPSIAVGISTRSIT